MVDRKPLEPGHRRKFLVVIDETPECAKAVQFAARRAELADSDIYTLRRITPEDRKRSWGKP